MAGNKELFKTEIPKGQVIKVASFTEPGKFYEVDLKNRTCTCPAFTKKGLICKHLQRALGIDKKGIKEMEKELTKGGYRIDECVSSLQKEIRRGDGEKAIFWGIELLETNRAWHLWRRLRVIAAEDLAGMIPSIFVKIMEYSFYATGQNSEDGKLIAAKTIMELARCPKDRDVDDYLCWLIEQKKLGYKLKVENYSIDEHTKRGRQMGKGDREFWLEGCKLENESPTYTKKWLKYFQDKFK